MTDTERIRAEARETESEDVYFDLMADLDFTKHVGGLAVTDRIIALAGLDASQHVLEVGCGVGYGTVYVARQTGCRITAVDVRPRMVERARARVAREGLADRVTLRVADGMRLPFEDNTFDAVIAESVISFFPDRMAGLREWRRVLRPGGRVAFTEVTWIAEPPAGYEANQAQAFGANLNILHPEDWQAALIEAGFEPVAAHVTPISAGSEARARLQQLGLRDILRVWGRTLGLLIRRPAYRQTLKAATASPTELMPYWGAGVWVGQK